eukprot:6029574-Pyramimonas_sp.AAC.1
MRKAVGSKRQPRRSAQGRWKDLRQRRQWQPSAAPLPPHAAHFSLRARATSSATFTMPARAMPTSLGREPTNEKGERRVRSARVRIHTANA